MIFVENHPGTQRAPQIIRAPKGRTGVGWRGRRFRAPLQGAGCFFGGGGYQGACGTLRYHRRPRWGRDADSPHAKGVNGDSEG